MAVTSRSRGLTSFFLSFLMFDGRSEGPEESPARNYGSSSRVLATCADERRFTGKTCVNVRRCLCSVKSRQMFNNASECSVERTTPESDEILETGRGQVGELYLMQSQPMERIRLTKPGRRACLSLLLTLSYLFPVPPDALLPDRPGYSVIKYVRSGGDIAGSQTSCPMEDKAVSRWCRLKDKEVIGLFRP